MEQRRVLAVRADGYGPGSGYLVAKRLLLTCAHVVGPVGSRVRVFRPAESSLSDGVVAWRGTPGGRDDGALVVLDAACALPEDGEVRWGRTVTFTPRLRCETWGIPNAVQVSAAGVEVAQPSGTLSPGDGLVADRYVVDLDGNAPDADSDAASSPWGGLSGAALFCGELLVGVVVGTLDRWGNRRLTVVPAYVLHASGEFRRLLQQHAAAVVLEPVEFQNVAESAVIPDPGGLVPSPAGLLVARRTIVPFHGRTELLDELTTWSRGTGVALWLVHGPGGQGKTRLARQLSAILAADGWTTAWMRPDARPQDLTVVARAARKTLVVVDYAESRTRNPREPARALDELRTGQLGMLLTALCERHESAPIRVLLLARTDRWWEDLAVGLSSASDLIESAPVTALPVLDADEPARRAAYRAAVDAFARALPTVAGQRGPDWVSLAHALPIPDFHDSAAVLSVHMTALADLLDAAYPEPVADPRTPAVIGVRNVEDRLLKHEYRYWYETASAPDHAPVDKLSWPAIREAMAAVHLCGAATNQQAEALIARIPGLHDPSESLRGAVRGWIAALYPPTSASLPWDGLQPDRLAERFVGRFLAEDPYLANALVPYIESNQAEQLLTVYTRAAAHPVFDHHLDAELTALTLRYTSILAPVAVTVATRVEYPAPLMLALQQIGENPRTGIETIVELGARVPFKTQVLAGWAARLSTRMAAELHKLPQVSTDQFAIAGSMMMNAVRLASNGQHEDAVAAGTQAVVMFRGLVARDPARFLPYLAEILNNVSISLAVLGRMDDSVNSGGEAVAIYRHLAGQDAKEYLPGLATSLSNLANRLGSIRRRHREAQAAFTDAISLHRTLVGTNAEEYTPGLALALVSYAKLLVDRGERKQALAPTIEAVEILRPLAEHEPDVYLEELATSLSNLSALLGELKQYKQGETAARDAVDAYRRLADIRPEAFLPDLAINLTSLSVHLGKLKQWERATAAAAEAVAIYRDTPKPDMAELKRAELMLDVLSYHLAKSRRKS